MCVRNRTYARNSAKLPCIEQVRKRPASFAAGLHGRPHPFGTCHFSLGTGCASRRLSRSRWQRGRGRRQRGRARRRDGELLDDAVLAVADAESCWCGSRDRRRCTHQRRCGEPRRGGPRRGIPEPRRDHCGPAPVIRRVDMELHVPLGIKIPHGSGLAPARRCGSASSSATVTGHVGSGSRLEGTILPPPRRYRSAGGPVDRPSLRAPVPQEVEVLAVLVGPAHRGDGDRLRRWQLRAGLLPPML